MNKQGCSDIIHIEDIINSIEEIITYASDKEVDKKTERAIERNIEIIGEAAKRISEKVKQQYPEVEWREIISMRNMLAHEYQNIDPDICIANCYKRNL